jgi:hypothetical protein
MAAPGRNGTRTKLIVNAGATTITIPNQSGSEATPTNRFVGPNEQDVSLYRGASVIAKYVDNRTNNARWQVVGGQGGDSLTGVDGVDVAGEQVRASRDYLADAISTAQINYNPTGWDTCDGVVVTSSPSLAGFTGFAAPTANGTREKVIICDRASTASLAIYHQMPLSSIGNRITCPGLATLILSGGECAQILYTDDNEWQVTAVGKATGAIDHGALTGLADDDHTQYLRVDGTRALGGTWSLGGYALTNVGDLTATGTPTWDMNGGTLDDVDVISLLDGGSFIDFVNGSAFNVDTIDFNGTGSIVTNLHGITMIAGGSGTIDMNGGSGVDIGHLRFDQNTPPSPGSDTDTAVTYTHGIPATRVGTTREFCVEYPAYVYFGTDYPQNKPLL